MSNLVQFRIPSPFILERCIPTPSQLAFGIRNGWLSPEGAVEIAAAKVEKLARVLPAEHELAQASSTDSQHIHELAEQLQMGAEPVESRAGLWLFLALDWIYSNRAEFEDPWEAIEMLYADSDYPSGISALVRWMPHCGPERPGLETMEKRWVEYLRTARRRFACINPSA